MLKRAGPTCDFRADSRPRCTAVPPQALSAAFGAGDLDTALDVTARLKYTDRIREAIERRIDG